MSRGKEREIIFGVFLLYLYTVFTQSSHCGKANLKYFLSEFSAQIYTWHSLQIVIFLELYSNIVPGYELGCHRTWHTFNLALITFWVL